MKNKMNNDRYFLNLKKRTQFSKSHKRRLKSIRSMKKSSDSLVKWAKKPLEEYYYEAPLTLEEQFYKDSGWSKEWIAKMTKKTYMLQKQRDRLNEMKEVFNIWKS